MNISWLKPEIDSNDRTDWLAIVVPANSDRLVELVAQGSCDLQIYDNGQEYAVDYHLYSNNKDYLYAELWRYLKSIGKVSDSIFTIYCHGIYRIINSNKVCVFISLNGDTDTKFSIDVESHQKALILWKQYQTEYNQWENNKAEYDEKRRISSERMPEKAKQQFIELEPFFPYPKPAPQEPRYNQLLESTPIGCWIPELPHHTTADNHVVLQALTETGANPPRDSIYTMIITKDATNGKEGALLIWTPRGDLVGYPEIRSAALQVIPSAFRKPHRTNISPPPSIILAEDTFERSPLDWTQINGSDLLELLVTHDIALEKIDDFAERADRGREWVKANGLDAIGWYQPFHIWDEEHWGIYLQTDRLLDVACGFYRELAHTQARPDSLAVLLSVGLVAHHELFHAKVEASATWLELLTRKGRYLAYQKDVYQACKLTDEWLEEALANWSAYAWLQSHLDQFQDLLRYQSNQSVLSVVEEWLDFSPPGYNNWAVGRQISSWRTLSGQLASGAVGTKLKKGYPPLEGLLNGLLPFDLIESDIPIWFVGQGAISDLFFSTPGRTEAKKLLKHFGYQIIPGRGKGSHEIWTGPDNRPFSLPVRDPVSRLVFTNLLHHFELKKETYLQKIRPQLK